MTLALSTISFFLLYYLSRKLLNELFALFYLMTHSRKISMYLVSMIVLPGTAIHEFAHLIMATILHVHTGKLTLLPEFDDRGNIKAGSIRIARPDPFRGTLIGLAPVIVGLTLLSSIGYFFQPQGQALSFENPLLSATYFLLLFQIGNTMFTSRSDLKDAVVVGCFFLGLGLLLHGLGVQISFTPPQTLIEQSQRIFEAISIGLIGAAGIDIIVLAIIHILVLVLRRLTN